MLQNHINNNFQIRKFDSPHHPGDQHLQSILKPKFRLPSFLAGEIGVLQGKTMYIYIFLLWSWDRQDVVASARLLYGREAYLKAILEQKRTGLAAVVLQSCPQVLLAGLQIQLQDNSGWTVHSAWDTAVKLCAVQALHKTSHLSDPTYGGLRKKTKLDIISIS